MVRVSYTRYLKGFELTGGAAVLLEVVVLAEQGVVLAGLEVEHLARRELLAAHGAGEAAQVVHLLPRLPHVVLRQDALPAPRALRPETPETYGGCEERIFQMPKFPVPTTATRRENHYVNIIPTATAHTTDGSAIKFTASDFTCAMPLPCHCIVNRNGGQRFCCLSSSQTRYATSEGACNATATITTFMA